MRNNLSKIKLRRVTALIAALLVICMLASGCGLTGSGEESSSVPFTSAPEVSSEVLTDVPDESTSEIIAGTTEGDITSGTLPQTETEPVPETTEIPEPIVESVVHFAACGDNILYRPAIWEAADRAVEGGRKYNFRPIYKNVEDIIAAADISFINQETVIAGEEYGYSGYPAFNSPQDIADELVDIGFDIVSLANNHIL
ncbi:MAG: CapA family protein, partial [Christensenellales bacterium]